MASSLNRISLNNEMFSAAVDQFVDENKPDQLSLAQLQQWTLEWQEPSSLSTDDILDNDIITKDELGDRNVIEGTLCIGGAYVELKLHCTCQWAQKMSTSASPEANEFGVIQWICRAEARFWTKTEIKKRLKADSERNSKADKIDQKIRSRMIARLKEDSYVSRLLNVAGDDDAPVLCEVKIRQSSLQDLEERVDVSDSICEAVKRSVWSSVEANIDMIGMIVNFPVLPTTAKRDTLTRVTVLANRAKLRLLEDAMVDACEQEGEDELLGELNLSAESIHDDDDDNDDDDDESSNRKKARSR